MDVDWQGNEYKVIEYGNETQEEEIKKFIMHAKPTKFDDEMSVAEKRQRVDTFGDYNFLLEEDSIDNTMLDLNQANQQFFAARGLNVTAVGFQHDKESNQVSIIIRRQGEAFSEYIKMKTAIVESNQLETQLRWKTTPDLKKLMQEGALTVQDIIGHFITPNLIPGRQLLFNVSGLGYELQ